MFLKNIIMSNEIQLYQPKEILDLSDIKRQYSYFFTDENSTDNYFCNCGQFFTQKVNNEYSEEGQESGFSEANLEELDSELSNIYKTIKFGMHDSITCPTCNKNYLTEVNKLRLISIGNIFLSGYEFTEDDDNMFLYY